MGKRKGDSMQSSDERKVKRLCTASTDREKGFNESCQKILADLSDRDLCTTGEFGGEYLALAKQIFAERNRHREFEVLNSPRSLRPLPNELSTRDYARILYVFRSEMKNVIVNLNPTGDESKSKTCFATMMEHCSNLETLTLRGQLPKSIFELAIPWGTRFVNLLSLKICIADYGVAKPFILEMFGLCPNLKQVSLIQLSYCDKELLHTIRKRLKYIEELEIVAGLITSAFTRTIMLPRLRKLDISQTMNRDRYKTSSLLLLQALELNSNVFESLAIDAGHCSTGFVRILKKFNNLKSLKLHAVDKFDPKFFDKISPHLKKLERLSICTRRIKDDEQMSSMIVDKFPKLKELDFNQHHITCMNKEDSYVAKILVQILNKNNKTHSNRIRIMDNMHTNCTRISS